MKLHLIAAILLLASCNEKVSPQLQNAASSTTVPPTSSTPSEYYFKLSNTSASILNYNLHKSGSGNYQVDCKITSTSALSNTNYRTDPTTNDITCFFEAEELSLFYSGLNFQVEASQNTCEYIGYMPFSFFDRMPGNSTANVTKKSCDDGVLSTEADDYGPAYSGGNTTCNEWVDTDIAAGVRNTFSVESDEDLCRFNYKDGDQEKCDVGVINVTDVRVSVQVDPTTGVRTTSSSSSVRTVRCGGKPSNCVKGPISLLTDGSKYTRLLELTQTTLNSTFSKQWELPSLMTSNKTTNRTYVNYRRHLANTDIDFDESSPITNPYKLSFSNYKTFNPSVMDRYSNNLMMDATTAAADASSWNIVNNAYRALPYAAEPFIGLSGYKTSPFYTFYCLDRAYDIKARIRMVVRDWDRVFPDTSDMEYLSDIFMDTSARQDIPEYPEVTDEQDTINNFNDKDDWDDFIPMKRTVGPYNSATTLWQPLPTGTYTDGFFNPDYFTNGSL